MVDLAAVYSREIDGEVLTISASGWTYKRLFVLWDYETDSIWYHLPNTSALTCVAGHYEGRTLEEFESIAGPWNVWHAGHPKTWVYREILGGPPDP